MTEAVMQLKAGREKSLAKHHPWIFSGAVESVEGKPEPGATVDVVDASGVWLAKAAYSPVSNIRGRIWTFQPDETVNRDFLQKRLQGAISIRRNFISIEETNAIRLVHGESDGLPGLVVDQYDQNLVVQILSAGMEYWRDEIVQLLTAETGIKSVYERSDVDVRELEGLAPRTGLLSGAAPDTCEIYENGLKFGVNFQSGQKTGFYIDQRQNRKLFRQMTPQGAVVLNCFCYTGAFTVNAFAAGASQVVSIDSSGEAIAAAKDNLRRNQMGHCSAEWMDADVFQQLRKFRDSRRNFDVIVLDPPKFAPTAAQAESASRGYKDINLLAFKLLNPGGLLFTYSCSGGISAELFQKIVAGAALDAGISARVLDSFHQGIDHPVSLNFPEGAYLKGLVCQVF